MRDIEARLIQVRKKLGLSQEKFGAAVGMSRSEVKNLEYEKTTLKDISIPLFCRAYNINETWLRTGEGEMFTYRTREDEITAYVGRIMGGKCSEFENAIISVMAKTSIEEWKMIEQKAMELLAALEAKEKPDQD